MHRWLMAIAVTGWVLFANVPAVLGQVTYQGFAEAKASTNTTSITISIPTGTSTGDLLIAAITTDGDNSGSLTPPAGEGWIQIALDQQGGVVTFGAWWKIAGASESSTHQFTWTTSEQAYGWMMRFTGHDAIAPIDATATTGGTSSTPTSPAVTTTIANTMILRLGGFDDDNITVDSPGLASHTAITMDKSNNGTATCSGGAGYVAQATAGSSGTSTFSLTASDSYRAVTIAIAQSPTIDLTSGLVAFWKLNDGSGTNAIDSSTNTNNGTLTNSPTWTDGVHGGAVDFDGVDDYIDAGSDASIDNVFSGTGSFTAWIYITGWGEGGWGRIVDKASSTIATSGWNLQMNGSNAQLLYATGFSSNRAEWSTPSGSLSFNRWYHIAVVYDNDSSANDPALYINGVQQTVTETITPSGTYNTDAAISLRLGNYAGDTTRTFDGSLDDVRIYSRGLSTGEIVRLANGSGLIAHWKFDDGAGTTATDSAGSNDGTLTGVPTWVTGKACGALDFDGTNDYVNMGDVLDLGDTDDVTITGWFNRDTFTTDDTIVAKRNSNGAAGDQGYIVYIDASSDNLIFKGDDGTDLYTLTSTTTFTATGWNHFAVVWDQDSATNCEIYINGVDDNAAQSGTIGNIGSLANALAFRVGAESDAGSKFDGKLDDIRVYGQTLLPWEIKNLAATYQVIDLGTSSGEPSLGLSVNDSEQVAGFDETAAAGDPSAWTSQYCAFTDLGTLTGGSIAEAHGINNSGTVCGWSDDTAGDRKAFTWTSGGGMTDLGTLSGLSDSEALAINSSDEVVGTALDFLVPPINRMAFLYLPVANYSLSVGMNSLGTLGGNQSVALGINDSGEVVGGAQNATQTMIPFIWLPSAAYGLSAGINSLGTLGGDSNEIIHRAQAINASGKVVGRSYTAGGEGHAFYWESGTMTDMGTLTAGTSSWALDINDSGIAVGTANISGGAFHAFTWDGTTMTDLNDLIDSNSGWTLTRATGINNDGEIVGWGTNSAGNTRAFMLIQTCAASTSSGGAIAAMLLVKGAGLTNANGEFIDLAVDDSGEVLAEVRVAAAMADEPLSFSVTAANNGRRAPGPGIGTLAGFYDNFAFDRTLIVEGSGEESDYVVSVSMAFRMDELNSAGVEPEDLQVHVLDVDTGIWYPAGKNIGESAPTDVVGEAGFVIYEDGSIDYWAQLGGSGIFAVGKPIANIERPSTPQQVPQLCGVALILPLFVCSLLIGLRKWSGGR